MHSAPARTSPELRDLRKSFDPRFSSVVPFGPLGYVRSRPYPSLCSGIAHFFVTPIHRNNQPAIKNTPPTGVATPISVRCVFSATFSAVSAYSDPQKKMIPMIKQFPAQIIHLLEIFSDTNPTNNSAKTW